MYSNLVLCEGTVRKTDILKNRKIQMMGCFAAMVLSVCLVGDTGLSALAEENNDASGSVSVVAGEITDASAVGANAVLEEIVEGKDSSQEENSAGSENEAGSQEESSAGSENEAGSQEESGTGSENESGSQVENSGSQETTESGKDNLGKNSEPSKLGSLPEALCCSFIVPTGFHLSDVAGQYVNEYYPLESANITYNVTKLPKAKVLTNAQKAAGESEDDGVEYRYDELTSEMYESIQKENYENLYGENINFTLESFENKEFEGFPGYLIKTSFTPENSQTIHQMTVMVLSSNKVFTIVFSRAEDDDFEEIFNKTLETIHVIGK